MDFTSLLNIQITMFILMISGAYLSHIKVISDNGKTTLTDLLVNFILPCNIINSFCISFSKEIFIQGFTILVISCLIQILSDTIGNKMYNHLPKEKKVVVQYATVCSNAGFLGNPIAEGVYGASGLLYASIYLIPQRIAMWSAGLSYFTETSDKKALIKKVLCHPCIVSVFIGIFIMICQIQLPTFLQSTLKSVSGCTTPLSMLLVGSILGDSNTRKMITKTTSLFSAIRLIIIPLIVFISCKISNVPGIIAGVSVILSGMPAGATTAILAVKYDGDSEFATKCVVLTTLMSVVMIPIWCCILKFMY